MKVNNIDFYEIKLNTYLPNEVISTLNIKDAEAKEFENMIYLEIPNSKDIVTRFKEYYCKSKNEIRMKIQDKEFKVKIHDADYEEVGDELYLDIEVLN